MPAREKPRSVVSWIRIIMFIIIPILFIAIFIGFFSFLNLRSQRADSLEAAIDYQTNALNEELKAINYLLGDMLINDQNVAHLLQDNNTINKSYYANGLIDVFNRNQAIIGSHYNFFYYDAVANSYFSTPARALSYEEMQNFRRSLPGLLNTTQRNFTSGKWTLFSIDGQYYMMNIYSYRGGYIGCWASTDQVFSYLDSIIGGEGSFYALLDQNQTPMTNPKLFEALEYKVQDQPIYRGFWGQHLIITKGLSRADFGFAAVDNTLEAYRGIIIMVLLLALASIAFAATSFYLLHHLQKEILKTVRYFSNHFSEYPKQKESGHGRIKEFMMATDLFDDLSREVQKLRIDIYEEKLQKQKIQLGYLQMQIKPHFYLNCLNVIYNMAQTQHFEEIQKLVMHMSEFLRYYFRNDAQFVTLKDELHYSEEYLQIQKTRFHSSLLYSIAADDDMLLCCVPPLIILSIIENAVKYTVTLDEPADIRVRCESFENEEGKFLQVTIMDNGPGFPEEVLVALENHLPVPLSEDGRKRIGISNTMSRLEFIYYRQDCLRCRNLPEGGANIELMIPFMTEGK